MSIIELKKDFADDLLQELTNAGIPASLHKEERYFGDPTDLVMVLDITNDLLGIAVSIITLWTIKHKSNIKINGEEHIPTTEEADEESVKRKLSQ
jgi:hypothetical protein